MTYRILWFLLLLPAGLRAQPSDSIPHHEKVASVAGIVAPAAMVTYGLISLGGDNALRRLDYDVRDALTRNDAFWHITAENYIQYAPAAAAFALKACGVRSAHSYGRMAISYGVSNLLMGGIVYGTKHAAGRERPDGSDRYSFPSGHTATAFAAAEFLHQEYRDASPWISVGGYAAATFVGAARVMNNKHWVSDVVAGAGIGILSTKLVYWVYPDRPAPKAGKPHALHAMAIPVYDGRTASLSLCGTF